MDPARVTDTSGGHFLAMFPGSESVYNDMKNALNSGLGAALPQNIYDYVTFLTASQIAVYKQKPNFPTFHDIK